MRPASVLRFGVLALLWGSSFLWIKVGLRAFSPVQLTFARLALGAVVLGALVAVQRGVRIGRRMWRHLMVAALVANVVPYTLFGIAEQTVGSNLAGVLNATTPLWTVVIAFSVGTERAVSGRRVAGLVLGFAGTVLILEPWSGGGLVGWGALACLAAAISYGVSYVYMGRFLAGRGIPPLVLAAAQLAVAAALIALALPFDRAVPHEWRADAVVSVVILGALGTGVAYVLNYRLIADEGPATASIVTYLLPLVAVVLGFIALGEPITIGMVGGGLLVLVGVALSQRRAPRTP